MPPPCTDPVLLNLWHPVAALEDLARRRRLHTRLLDHDLTVTAGRAGAPQVRLADGRPVAAQACYGHVWVALGDAPKPIFDFPEVAEPDRRFVVTGVFRVRTSAGRAVENFLDMAHFPYVHTGILGAEPHTEVKDYDVEISDSRDEIRATRCRFFQPRAAVASTGGAEVDYIYRVPHPNCAILYKSSPNDPVRLDAIFLFLQPMGEELVGAHTGMCILDDRAEPGAIRHFQQVIFGQDKPILENQLPRRLPLDPRAETPIRADRSAIAYRRWLGQKGLRWGVIPAG